MRMIPASLLFVLAGSAQAAQLPFTGAFGTPFAFKIFASGGARAVWNYEDRIPKDDAFVLFEPTGLTSTEWNCDVTSVAGTRVDLHCVDGSKFVVTIDIRSDELIMSGDETTILPRCPATPVSERGALSFRAFG